MALSESPFLIRCESAGESKIAWPDVDFSDFVDYSWRLECLPGTTTALMTMPRNKLIQERIELRRWQPLDRLPRWPHFHHVGWAVYEWPFA
jgi:hypothetical protein